VAELAVVVPTYNEAGNLQTLTRALETALHGIAYEVIIVDDNSPDGTAALARRMAQIDPRVRVVERIGRSGLASAVIEGVLASSAPYVAVIDADMQHDESVLPAMLKKLKDESLDIVIGTRHAADGGMGSFARSRVRLSNAGKWLSDRICGTPVSDPMSGFFVLTRRFFDEVAHRLSGTGFKILVDIMASSRRRVRFGEVGYVFRNRFSGESKLDILVGLEYLTLLLDKVFGRWVPVTVVLYFMVGALGVFAYAAVVAALRQVTGWPFPTLQAVASSLVIVLNFFLNNTLTFRRYRYRGVQILRGLALYYCACLVGLIANVYVAGNMRVAGVPVIASAAIGLAVGSVWNYLISSIFIWQITRVQPAVSLASQRPVFVEGGEIER
jgi:dolichol-phosphate mannosyltransferase